MAAVTSRSGRPLVSASLTITAVTIAGRLAVAGRDLLVAREFGVSTHVDAYFVAVVLPSLLAVALAGALQTAVLPAQVALADSEVPSASFLIPLVRAVGCRLLLIAAAVVLLAWPIVHLLGSGFAAAPAADARAMLCLVALIVPLSGVSGVLSGSLAARRRFGQSVSGQLMNGFVGIVTFLLLEQALGVGAAALGVLLGYAAEVATLGHFTGFSYSRLLSRRQSRVARDDVRRTLHVALPLVVASLLISGNSVIDQAFAGTLPSGSVSALAYATKFVLFATIPLSAIGLALFPDVSELVASGDDRGVRGLVRRRSLELLGIGAALVPFMIVFGRVAVEHLIESTASTSVSTVSSALTATAFMLPVFGVAFFLLRVLVALERSRWVMWIAFGGAIVNVIADIALKGPFGITGIAVGTVIVQCSSCLVLAIAVNGELTSRAARAEQRS